MHALFSEELPPCKAIPLAGIDPPVADYAQLLTDKTENKKQPPQSAGAIQSPYWIAI